jgi:uncharacterized BrkB/YihY/UPF0761 family membrane protein
MDNGRPSRTAALAARLTAARARAETLPGGSLVREIAESERELGGGLIAGGVAFRVFLWLVPFGLVVAAVLSFWSEHDRDGLERASREFGVSAAATEAAADALQNGDRNVAIVLIFGMVTLAWFTLGAVRARPYPRTRLAAQAREQLGTFAILGLVVTLAVSTAIAASAMWFLPRRATQLRELLPGALLVAVGVQLINLAVVFYFAPRLGRSEETYGAFGTAATMLVWLYVISRLITGAAFVNAILWSRRHAQVDL